MSDLNRRQFLHGAAVIGTATTLGGCANPDRRLDADAIRALCRTVLPDSLSDADVDRIATDFGTWAVGLEAGREITHGYGTSDIRQTGDDPRPQWAIQLLELDAFTRGQFGTGWTATSNDARRSLLGDLLASNPTQSLPSPARAQHVAVAVLAWFYETPEATDLAYRAGIQKLQCRPLDRAPREPVSLA
jgi:hypothetical protein